MTIIAIIMQIILDGDDYNYNENNHFCVMIPYNIREHRNISIKLIRIGKISKTGLLNISLMYL